MLSKGRSRVKLKWAASGDLGHQVFETKIGRIAILICMDIPFIETARLVAIGGADVICHISNWLAERTPAPYWISRAYENGCYLMESNRWGLERGVQFSSGSCIIGPEAQILDVVDDGDGIAYGLIDPARSRERRVAGEPVMLQRRPELYRELMTNTYAWNPRDFFRLYGHQPLADGRVGRSCRRIHAIVGYRRQPVSDDEPSRRRQGARGRTDRLPCVCVDRPHKAQRNGNVEFTSNGTGNRSTIRATGYLHAARDAQ